nr:protein kinase family protein [Thermocrispum agreste]
MAPGGVVGDGRYRLLAQLGIDQRAGAHFWRARDGQLRRDVALTLLVGDPADAEAARAARRTLERAAHAAQFNHPAVARVLDVLSLGSGISAGEGLLGIVVSEWSKGTDLIDVIADGPVTPAAACRMLEQLVDAVEQAHNHGLVLGIDHPQRIRVGPDGVLRLAFAGPMPQATLRHDVRALGALLYLLLTARWPLPGGPGIMQPAPQGPNGRVVPPRSINAWVPQELSALATHTLADGGEGGIRTSAAFLRVLRQAAEVAERDELIQSGQLPPDSHQDPDGGIWTTQRPTNDPARRRKVALGATLLVVAAVAIIAWVGLSLISFFETDDGATGPEVNVAESSGKRGQKDKKDKEKQVAAAAVTPSQVQVYNPEGTGDSVDRAPKAIDGDPSTLWKTDVYKQQLPALKSGVGLSVSFDKPIDLAKVVIHRATKGSKVEVRVADNPNPFLDDARVVVKETEVSGDKVELTLAKPTKTSHVIVWITKLGGDEGAFATSIGELKFFPAAQP